MTSAKETRADSKLDLIKHFSKTFWEGVDKQV